MNFPEGVTPANGNGSLVEKEGNLEVNDDPEMSIP